MPLNLIPAAGMKFTMYDKAWDFYNNYARCAGFGIRKRAKHRTNAYIVRSREGTHKETVSDYNRKRQKTSKRIDCKAKIRVKKRKDGNFLIEMVELNHNHKMLESPGMLLHMRSHKREDPLIDQLVKDMQLDNHTHAQMMSTLSRNRNNRVRNIFWAKASCKGSYEDFGDCVTFDTTYKTNKFHMAMGVFVGVHHHLQSAIFVVALMRDETIPSFEWVFKTFLRCMNNKPPICMLTDQCSSMKVALKTILPDALHKLCRWHIMKKYKDHLALLYKAHEKLKDDLNAVLNHPLMPSEFERSWRDLIQKYNLQNDEVMISLWDERHEWISAYYNEIFCARMTSTQRSESMNRILKKNFVKEKHDLHLFTQQVDKCIQTRKAVEHAEIVANESEVKTTTQFGFEVQLSKVYTRAVFADIKETLYRSAAFRAERCHENPTKYLVHHYNRSDAFD
ncbi:protein FAR1-RELATED SEQUENCE 5-like [Aegilops tauschii subsp. strangulata]|uniref:protein FAR1-RELATED SEQUENCE 5-like n=1 Tax=Aegilops tauschii subsp. strangulata TaxID=200361 RepID=UPI001ABC23E7|nr:protein FAR1-RELATED SEQUENCE 5-like [Aegilops tauschii subsp. strangulata]